jgi:hypothetical protein
MVRDEGWERGERDEGWERGERWVRGGVRGV